MILAKSEVTSDASVKADPASQPYPASESSDWPSSQENGLFQSPFEAKEMLCLLSKSVLFTNQE